MKRLFALFLILLPFVSTVQGAYSNRIAKLEASLRFVFDRVEESNPGLCKERKFEKVYKLLQRLGFSLPSCKKLPTDPSPNELARAIASGKPKERGLGIPFDSAKDSLEMEKDVVSNAVQTVDIVPIAKLRFSTSKRVQQLAQARNIAKEGQQRQQGDQKPPSSAASLNRIRELIKKLSREAQRQLTIHDRRGESPNPLVISSWRGLGLPLPKVSKDWKSIPTKGLARSIEEGLNERQLSFAKAEIESLFGSYSSSR